MNDETTVTTIANPCQLSTGRRLMPLPTTAAEYLIRGRREIDLALGNVLDVDSTADILAVAPHLWEARDAGSTEGGLLPPDREPFALRGPSDLTAGIIDEAVEHLEHAAEKLTAIACAIALVDEDAGCTLHSLSYVRAATACYRQALALVST